jgi:hypothetical protein
MSDPKNDATASAVQPDRCGAKKRNGEPCRRWPLKGTNRCRLHGGASPQAQKRARERIIGAADLAAARLIEFMNDKRVPYSVRLAATRDLLDRGIGTAAQNVKLGVADKDPWGELLAEVMDDEVLPVATRQRRALTAATPTEDDEDYNATAQGEAIYHPDADDAAPLDGWRINNDGEDVVRGEVIRSRVNPPRHIRDGLDLDASGGSRRVDFG